MVVDNNPKSNFGLNFRLFLNLGLDSIITLMMRLVRGRKEKNVKSSLGKVEQN